MLVSTCGVLAGASGGAVVDLRSPSSAPSSPVVALVVSNTRHLASGRTLAHLNYAVCGAALRACWDHAAELAGGGKGEGGEREGRAGGGAVPAPVPPEPEARAALWALAAVPRISEGGGRGAGGGAGAAAGGKSTEARGGRAALDRLLERAGMRRNDDGDGDGDGDGARRSGSFSSPRSLPAATADWPSRL